MIASPRIQPCMLALKIKRAQAKPTSRHAASRTLENQFSLLSAVLESFKVFSSAAASAEDDNDDEQQKCF